MSWVSRQGNRAGAWRTLIFLTVVIALACGDRAGLVEPPSARVTGRVVDSSTLLPVAAAQVSLGGLTIVTDGSGRFELTGVPTGPARLRCVATGFVDLLMDVTVLADGVELEVRLEPLVVQPARVEGIVVVASTGAPVTGAEVSIGDSTTSTGSDGRFALNGLVTGPAELRAVAAGFEDHQSEITLYPGGTANIALRSLTEPGVTFDLTARVRRFDPAWGDQTGALYTAVLTLPADYRTAGSFGGTMSEWRYVLGDEVHAVGTWRIKGTVLSGGGVVMEADRLLWTMSARVGVSGDLVGSWGCCSATSGSFEAVLRPPS